MTNKIKIMIKTEIIEQVNHKLKGHGFLLIDPASADLELDADGLLWMADETGKIVLLDIDIFSFTDGFNLLKPDVPFGFNDCVANICDALLGTVLIDEAAEDEEWAAEIES